MPGFDGPHMIEFKPESSWLMRLGMTALVILFALFVIGGAIKKRAYEHQITDLQNQVAARDKTIELKDGLYQKSALDVENLKGLLDKRDAAVAALEAELKKSKEKLVAVSQVSVAWKKKYEASVQGKQSQVPSADPSAPPRLRVDFAKDFGYIGVEGFTLTDPPEATVAVHQNRPLKLNVAMVQDEKGQWKTVVSSSEPDVGIDIGVTAVNTKAFSRRWYERLGLTLSAGLGKGSGVGSLGVQYDAGQFEFGPTVWLASMPDRTYQMIGGTLTWRPFSRNK